MKVTIERAALFKALSHVQSVVERKQTIPILSNVLLRAEAGKLHFTATDLDMEIEDSAAANVERKGAVTAPAATLFDVVRKLPDGAEVRLETKPENSRIEVVAGRARFVLPTLPAADFQTMTREASDVTFDMATADLKRFIDRVKFAISSEETRYYLNGIYFHVTEENGGQMRAVATDGHRLALAASPMPEGAAGLTGIIVPRKAITEVRRLLDDAPDVVTVSASAAKIGFEVGEATLTSKLIEGSFPNYARVIPKDNTRILRLDNRAFSEAVDRVSTVSAERARSVKMAIEPDRVILMVSQAERGQATEELAADFSSGMLEIGFNGNYLKEACQQVQGTELEMAFNDAALPAIMRDPTDKDVLFVLMPMRV
jgi:DNA polymerase-3 subunit beta